MHRCAAVVVVRAHLCISCSCLVNGMLAAARLSTADSHLRRARPVISCAANAQPTPNQRLLHVENLSLANPNYRPQSTLRYRMRD